MMKKWKKNINRELGQLPNHQLLQRLSLSDLLWDFDAISLYPSAMSDPESIYPRIETGYALKPVMNNDIVKKFNNQTFTQGRAISKSNYHNPKNLIVQNIQVTEREEKIEINRMCNGYVVDVLTSVDIQENDKTGGKVIEFYEDVIFRKNFKVSPFKKVSDEIFELRQKNKDENNDVMQLLVKMTMNSLHGEQIREDIEESYQCKSEIWLMTEYDERVLDYQRVNYGNYIVKMKDDDGLEDHVKKVNTMPLQMGAFVFANSKRILNKFIHAIIGFYTNDVYYTDTDSFYIENKHWDKVDKTELVGKNRLHGKDDYKEGGIWYGLVLSPKIKYCSDINEFGIIDEQKTFKGFTNVSDKLDRKEYFNMAGGGKLADKGPLSWKKSFSQGIVIPHKMRSCNKCIKDILRDQCDKLLNQRKEFSANLNEIKCRAPNEFDHMLPKYITT